jgi:nicotinamide mononucleotide transporter
MNYIEIIAAISTLISVWFSVKKNKLLWPTGIIGIGAYLWLFYTVQLYADFGLQFIYLAQSLYGWWYWSGGKEKIEPPITELDDWWLYMFIPINTISWTLFLHYFLVNYTNASLPYFDALCSVISLTANWLLAKKKIESWYLWILVDTIYVGVFIYKELYLSAVLYAVFFFMAINGLQKWRKELE